MYTPPTPGITTSQRPLSYAQDCEPPKPIPPPCFLGRLISHPSFKTPAANPLVSFESSAAISTMPSAPRTPRTTNSQDNFDQGQQVDARGCDRERSGKNEREIDMDVSASSLNFSPVSDTSTSQSTSSPSSSADNLPPYLSYLNPPTRCPRLPFPPRRIISRSWLIPYALYLPIRVQRRWSGPRNLYPQ
jgi:hypothetical protein